MTKKELVITSLSTIFGTHLSFIPEIVDLFMDAMKKGLKDGDTVEKREFGVLRVREQ